MLLTMLLLYARSAPCAVVSETEAIAVADRWYAMELNSGRLKMDETEAQGRLARLGEREVSYLVSAEEVLDHPPDEGVVLAYIVTYKPRGFVVVAGEDKIQPIVVFDAESTFRWETVEENFLRYFLGREMPRRWQAIEGGPHPLWACLRSRLGEEPDQVAFTETERSVFVLWDTATWHQFVPYNELVCAANGDTDGVATGCCATAMAIKMRFHSWPAVGSGSDSYNDVWGDLQFSHYANFGAHTYNWQNMPTGVLTESNLDVAHLMYHCGVTCRTNYEIGPSGGNYDRYVHSMTTYFGYKGADQLTTQHDVHIRNSIMGGLPVVTAGGGHAVVADGYRDTESPFYHLNLGWNGGGNGWYDLYSQYPGDPPSITHCYPYTCPQNYMYVDANYSGICNGTMQGPFPSLAQGVAAVPEYGHLWIKTASYPSPIAFDKPMTIRSYEGAAVVGDNLSLSMAGVIRTHGTGELRIY